MSAVKRPNLPLLPPCTSGVLLHSAQKVRAQLLESSILPRCLICQKGATSVKFISWQSAQFVRTKWST